MAKDSDVVALLKVQLAEMREKYNHLKVAKHKLEEELHDLRSKTTNVVEPRIDGRYKHFGWQMDELVAEVLERDNEASAQAMQRRSLEETIQSLQTQLAAQMRATLTLKSELCQNEETQMRTLDSRRDETHQVRQEMFVEEAQLREMVKSESALLDNTNRRLREQDRQHKDLREELTSSLEMVSALQLIPDDRDEQLRHLVKTVAAQDEENRRLRKSLDEQSKLTDSLTANCVEVAKVQSELRARTAQLEASEAAVELASHEKQELLLAQAGLFQRCEDLLVMLQMQQNPRARAREEQVQINEKNTRELRSLFDSIQHLENLVGKSIKEKKQSLELKKRVDKLGSQVKAGVLLEANKSVADDVAGVLLNQLVALKSQIIEVCESMSTMSHNHNHDSRLTTNTSSGASNSVFTSSNFESLPSFKNLPPPSQAALKNSTLAHTQSQSVPPSPLVARVDCGIPTGASPSLVTRSVSPPTQTWKNGRPVTPPPALRAMTPPAGALRNAPWMTPPTPVLNTKLPWRPVLTAPVLATTVPMHFGPGGVCAMGMVPVRVCMPRAKESGTECEEG